MPKRTWGYVAALGLTLATSVLAQTPEQDRAQRQSQQTAQQQNQRSQAIENPGLPGLDWFLAALGILSCGPNPMDRLPDGTEVGQQNYYTACDLDAQESVANSTRWLLWIALLQTGIGIAGTYLVWRSLSLNREATRAATKGAKQARKANRLAAKNAAIDQRAWLSIGDPTFQSIYVRPTRPEGYVLGLNYKLSFTNSGKTPASDIVARFSAAASSAEQKETAEAIETQMGQPHEDGFSVGPGEILKLSSFSTVTFVVPADQQQEIRLNVTLYVAANYAVLGNEQRQTTRALFSISKQEPGIVCTVSIPRSALSFLDVARIDFDPSKMEVERIEGTMT